MANERQQTAMNTSDLEHLDCLRMARDVQATRLKRARKPEAKAFYAAQVVMLNKEVLGEMEFLDGRVAAEVEALTDEELLAELNS